LGKTRLEAFSDGVLAIIITIMVLELKVPHGEGFSALTPLIPVFFSYLLSFLYVGIYWNNHHHLMHTAKNVTGGILWANLHLLFWLSLIPFTTGWMGENHFAPMPTFFYGIVLLMCAIAYWVLQNLMMREQGEDSILRKAVGKDWKGKLSPLIYLTAMAISFWHPFASLTLYVFSALIWIAPDKRIEKFYSHGKTTEHP
jgi:uncharacterized membrane protein